MYTNKYEPPYNKQKLVELGLSRLLKDPAHAWRAETGTELIHKEPDAREFLRIWNNWNKMPTDLKRKSDKKSLELFGKTNKDNFLALYSEYKKDPKFTAKAKRYYDAQGSHGWNHVSDVLNRARLMVAQDNRLLSDEEIAAVLFHDSSLRQGDRETHHIDSAKIAEKELKKSFDPNTISRIAKAIREHRGSYKGKYSSKLSELVSSADRGEPNLDDIIKRSYTYQVEHNFDVPEKLVVEHIKDKYSRAGYARKPEYYQRLYRDRLDDMYERVDRLTPKEVLSVVGNVTNNTKRG